MLKAKFQLMETIYDPWWLSQQFRFLLPDFSEVAPTLDPKQE